MKTDKYDSYYRLGYQDALVWNIGPHDRKGIEEGYEDSYADGFKDGLFKAHCEDEDSTISFGAPTGEAKITDES